MPQEELHFQDRCKYAWEQVCGTAKKVLPYVLIGVGIGAVIHNWIPEELVVNMREAAGADDCWTHDVIGDWKEIFAGNIKCACEK